MTDATSTDMAGFYRRYDARHRLMFVAALSASLVLCAVNLAHGPFAIGGGGTKAVPLAWAFAILFPPLAIAAWWGAQEFIMRWRDRRPAMSADEAPNGRRIANAGFLFSVALVACVLGSQAVVTFAALGYVVGDWILRATWLGMGVAMICLGNVWPRLPMRRAPAQKAAAEMKINRVWGWIMVILGLGAVLSGLLPPLFHLSGGHHS
jgi:hypothetical protein